MVSLIATEAMIFAALLSGYFFVRAGSPVWPQGGIAPPELARISIFTVDPARQQRAAVLGRGGGPPRADRAASRVGLALSWLMGAAFLVNQLLEFGQLEFSIDDNAYASLFIVITGLHGLHVLAGLVISVVVQLKAPPGCLRRAPPLRP